MTTINRKKEMPILDCCEDMLMPEEKGLDVDMSNEDKVIKTNNVFLAFQDEDFFEEDFYCGIDDDLSEIIDINECLMSDSDNAYGSWVG